ncbi:mycofactocin biosynthesis peptidyl-dipeptidase MftE [Nocardia jejuensis]|uniref:mycofactocin biosynthesis peptidyl-dipeptidase MftE n=1 Tax=Nocardia jejuensis TaxID=328049 RepID=UPI00082961EB|nr:mycofactocin biosynthesis peptidyl-dipeptidase MftE [Nocardia jejuensis]
MTAVRRLADLAWPEVHELAANGALLAIPLGATEQHGPHLPLSTDTEVAIALCEALAHSRDDVVIAPAVPYGSSGEHIGFAGTLSIGQDATELVITELGRSACETFAHVLFVSAHGGNAGPLTRAVARLRVESRDVRAYTPAWDGDPHAGHIETAIMLTLRPTTVRMDRAETGNTRPLRELMPQLREHGLRAVTENGILGDPLGATAFHGDLLLGRLAAALSREVSAWRATEPA